MSTKTSREEKLQVNMSSCLFAIQTSTDGDRIRGPGDHLVSRTALPAGTDVLSEMPFCFVMFDEARCSDVFRRSRA